MILILLLPEPFTQSAVSQFEKITNPILGILLIVLIALVVYLLRQCKYKDDYIKELHETFSTYSIKNIEVLNKLENSISMDDTAHRNVEILIRENNVLLKRIIDDTKHK